MALRRVFEPVFFVFQYIKSAMALIIEYSFVDS